MYLVLFVEYPTPVLYLAGAGEVYDYRIVVLTIANKETVYRLSGIIWIGHDYRNCK